MALELYYGSPVSGYADKVYRDFIGEAVENSEKPYYILVPEQASLTAQETAVRLHPNHILSNIDVVTFMKLSREVFSETRTETKDLLDDLGKTMLLRLVIAEQEKNLKVLQKGVRREGMLSELKSVLSEFSEYGIQPDDLVEAHEKLAAYPALQRKLDDLSILHRAFLDKVHERYDIQEERLTRLGEVLTKWPQKETAVFLLDGFTGFTPPQYAVLNALLSGGADVRILLTLGSEDRIEDEKPEEALFHMTYAAAGTLKEAAVSAGKKVTETFVTGVKDGLVSPEIAAVERSLFRDRILPYDRETDKVRIARFSGMREEVRFVVSEILSLIRQKMRYRDIAIVSGDPERYREELEESLNDAGIPYFMDENRSVGETVWYRFLESAMEITATGFGSDAVMDFLKNPIVQYYALDAETESTIYELENYVLAMGVRGEKRFQEPFTYTSSRFPEERLHPLNLLKDKLLQPVFRFSEALKGGRKPAEDSIEALRTLLRDYRAEEGTETFSKEAERLTGESLSEEYRRIGETLYAFLDRADEILKGFLLSAEEFRSVLRSGMDAMHIGRVPATKDRVVIGDVKRTRLGEIRHLFLIGANVGLLPKPSGSEGVMNDADRAVLKENNVRLSGTASERAFEDRYYLYRLFTAPKNSLTLTYAASDSDGKPMKAALAVSVLKRLFPRVTIESPEQDPRFGIVTERTGETKLALSLGRYRAREAEKKFTGVTEEDRALYQWYRSNRPEALATAERGFHFRYRPERLDKAEAAMLYGSRIEGSVTRLERYAACPYRHFMQYGLGLKPRDEYRLERSDVGSLLHNSIETFFEKLEEAGKSWHKITADEQDALAKESAALVASTYGNDIMNASEKNQYLVQGVYRVLSRSLWALKKQWDDGRFAKTESEIAFGRQNGIRFQADENTEVCLEGRIDRIDTKAEPDRVFVKVIDYKSSAKSPDYTALSEGRQLQLFLYLKVAIGRAETENPGKRIIPVGVYYFHLHDPILTKESDDPEADRYREFQLNGLTAEEGEAIRKIDTAFDDETYTGRSRVVKSLQRVKEGGLSKRSKVASEEEIRSLADFALTKAKALTKEIVSGEIGLEPAESSCKYCEYRESCGFDRKLPGYKTRKSVKKTLKDLVEESTDEVDSETKISH